MVEFKSSPEVVLVDNMGSDEFICKAARVSTLGAASLETSESRGFLNFLMKNRHGSPFEHGAMTFRISAPIFVWREFMRHRVGFSYNEQSGRYMEMEPIFYRPSPTRPLQQVGKTGEYTFVTGTQDQIHAVSKEIVESSERAWASYQQMLDAGIAKEVARMVLPVNIFSTAYVTCNPRSLMSFLSLRTHDEESKFPSFPMHEINQVANQMESCFFELYPLTSGVFNDNGRVSP